MKIKIQERLKSAMLSKNKGEIKTLRNVLTKISEKEKEKGLVLSDEDIISVIEKYIKQRRESYDAAFEAAREDLLQDELDEISILEAYVPKKYSVEELKTIIKAILDKGVTNMGAIMKELSVYGSAVDKKEASALIKTLL